MGGFVSRGFKGRRRPGPADQAKRLPPGQYAEPGFPVLTAGPTPRVDLAETPPGQVSTRPAPSECDRPVAPLPASARTEG